MSEREVFNIDVTSRPERQNFGKNKSGWLSFIIGFVNVKGFMISENFGYSSLYYDDKFADTGFGVMGFIENNFDEVLDELSLAVTVSRSARNDALHRRLKKEVDFVCQVCGFRFPESGELTVHHIDSVWNDDPTNLIISCMNCHEIIS